MVSTRTPAALHVPLAAVDLGPMPSRADGGWADACAVLTVADVLDRLGPATVAAGIEIVLDRLDAVLSARPRVVVADLRQVDPSQFMVGLLRIMSRRAARAGAALVLVGLSVTLRAQLDQAKVSGLHTTLPDVPRALLAFGVAPAAAG